MDHKEVIVEMLSWFVKHSSNGGGLAALMWGVVVCDFAQSQSVFWFS